MTRLLRIFASLYLIGILCAQANTPSIPNHAVVLLYHHVANDTPTITSITPELFKQQLHYLKTHNFQVWPLLKIIEALKNKQAIPDKVVAITFDDSYQSVYDEAYPLLKSYQWPFTIFVSTDAIDGGYNHQTSWQQLRIMAANGATISNHSASHSHLLKRKFNENNIHWQQRIIQDIKKAQRRIKKEIGSINPLFAYPYGENNQALRTIVKRLGLIGFGQQSGAVGEYSDQLNLPRFPFSGKYSDLKDFSLKVHTIALPIVSFKAPNNPLTNNQLKPELLLTLVDSFMDSKSLRCFGSGQGIIMLEWLKRNQIKITPKQPIPLGRSRYNCTALFNNNEKNNRYYWYSHSWLRLDKEGRWLEE